MSQKIMKEVSKASTQKASWGLIWIIVLFLAATPLTASIRSGFINIMGLPSKPEFFKNKISNYLEDIYDLDKLLRKLEINIINPNELHQIYESIHEVKRLGEYFKETSY